MNESDVVQSQFWIEREMFRLEKVNLGGQIREKEQWAFCERGAGGGAA